jgi:hypothetical protein
MHAPPDPQNARRPSSPKPGPVSQISQFSNIDTYTTPLDFQARKLSRLFFLPYTTARTVAALAFGGLAG